MCQGRHRRKRLRFGSACVLMGRRPHCTKYDFAKTLEIAERHFERGGRRVGIDVRGALRFQQCHFAERHSCGNGRQTYPTWQPNVNGAGLKEKTEVAGSPAVMILSPG